ncbi:hypothetical protein [Fulvivirga sp.]|uniref:hypothetical protein n=1 Tax=Fulvivirga sp. TaxID=1931237 RepID=UPI0032EB3765
MRPLIDSANQVRGNEERLSTVATNYSHLGENGRLGLLFYEDKLVAVGFYPVDSSAYLDKLEIELGLSLSKQDSIIDHDKIITKGYDYEMGSIGGFFISWMDSNLRDKYKGTVW